MTSSLRLWLLVAALLAGALAVACGGNGDDGDDGDSGEPAPTVPAGDGEEPQDADADGGQEPAGDLGEELRNLAAEFGITEVKIDYEFSAAENGDSQSGSLTLYWKPPDAWRMDFSSDGEGVTMITTGETGYICSDVDGEGQCLRSPAAGAIPIPFLSFFADPDELTDLIDETILGLDVERSQETIAGRDASCFSIEGTIEGETGSAEYCFSSSGILLRLRSGGSDPTGGGEFRLEATSVEDEVSGEDLEPPYPVMELPDLPDLPDLDP